MKTTYPKQRDCLVMLFLIIYALLMGPKLWKAAERDSSEEFGWSFPTKILYWLSLSDRSAFWGLSWADWQSSFLPLR